MKIKDVSCRSNCIAQLFDRRPRVGVSQRPHFRCILSKESHAVKGHARHIVANQNSFHLNIVTPAVEGKEELAMVAVDIDIYGNIAYILGEPSHQNGLL